MIPSSIKFTCATPENKSIQWTPTALFPSYWWISRTPTGEYSAPKQRLLIADAKVAKLRELGKDILIDGTAIVIAICLPSQIISF